MDESTDDLDGSIVTTRIERLLVATTSSAAIEATQAAFGPHAELHVIDHEFGHLVPVAGAGDALPLDRPRRSAMLRSRSHFDGERTWIPLPEGRQPIFVVAVEGEHARNDAVARTLGAVLGGHRERLEDLEHQRRRSEMAVAAELQWDLLPNRADELGDYQLAGVLEPAYEIAGDVFDYAMYGDDVWAYSFDGMGHGLDATLTSVLVLSAVRNSRREGGSLVEQMQLANEILWDQHGGDRFVTGAACRLGPDGTVEVVNAGHEPLRLVADGRVDRLDLLVDLPLGVQHSTTYRSQVATVLDAGDGVVMFSDGPASQKANGVAYGDDHLDRVLEASWSDVPFETGHDVIDDVLGHLDGARVEDDITAVVVRRAAAQRAGS